MKLLILATLALLLAACGRPAPHGQESYVFGTRVEVLVWGEPEDKARAAVAAVLREFDRLHRDLPRLAAFRDDGAQRGHRRRPAP